jgi:hypothetical protein
MNVMKVICGKEYLEKLKVQYKDSGKKLSDRESAA